jgi:hypothetical protein
MLLHADMGYLVRTGWQRSLMVGYPCDTEGGPLPWMNFPVIAFLKGRLTSDQRLFEYGSGYSTLFYAARTASVVSIEYDKQWYDRVSSELNGLACVLHCSKDEDGRYCRMIHEAGGTYDVVVIDGADRVNCLRETLLALSERGVIILDDVHRERSYAPAFQMARDAGFRHVIFEGLKPGGYGELVATAIFYRDGNCFGI